MNPTLSARDRFVGVCAASAVTGLGALHHGDALFKRALLAASRTCVALLTDDKLGAKVPHRVAAVKDIDAFVVERTAPQKALDALRGAGTTILRADRPA